MSIGNHHSDTNLPAVEVNPTTEEMFGAKAKAKYPWKLGKGENPISSNPSVFHDEAPEEETLDYSNPVETFDRGASPFEGMDSHPDPVKMPEIGQRPVVFSDENLPQEGEKVDPKLIFSTEGMD